LEEDTVESVLLKKSQSETDLTSSILSRGALYQNMIDDNNIYLWGGTTSFVNISSPGFDALTSAEHSLWAYDTALGVWNRFDVSEGRPNRPSSAAFAEVPDQGLAYFFNGQRDSGSSTETQNLGDKKKVPLQGMIALNLKDRTARNLSTSAVSGEKPSITRAHAVYPRDWRKGDLGPCWRESAKCQ
jgi:hypothetical protein